MNKLSFFILLLTLSSCSTFSCSTIDNSRKLVFYDSHGVLYPVNTTGLTIKEEFKLSEEPKIIFLATSDEENIKFKQQLNIFYKVNAEEMQYLYVIANSKKEDKSGYYADSSLSEEILSGENFKIIIYGKGGVVITESTSVLTKSELIYYLLKT